MGEREKTEGHSYKSPAVVGLRADPTSDKINGKRRKEQGGVRSFRGMLPVGPGYQQGKQRDIALTGEEVKPEPESQEGFPFVEEYALHFWFWSLSRGGIWVITNIGVKLREKVD